MRASCVFVATIVMILSSCATEDVGDGPTPIDGKADAFDPACQACRDVHNNDCMATAETEDATAACATEFAACVEGMDSCALEPTGCELCVGRYEGCVASGIDSFTCIDEVLFNCMMEHEVDEYECELPEIEPNENLEGCEGCQEEFFMVCTREPDATVSGCVTRFLACTTEGELEGCAIDLNCADCQQAQQSCEDDGGDHDTCVSGVFADCVAAANLSHDEPDFCTPDFGDN